MAKEKVKLWTPPFLIRFPSLFTARKAQDADEGAKAKFGCSAVWTPANFTPRDKELWKAIKAALDEEAQRAFKMSWDEMTQMGLRTGLRNGKLKADLEGFGEGTMYASLTSNLKPGVVDINGNDIIDPQEIFDGCICRATVNVYSFENKGKGVAIGLYNIQLLAGEGHPKVKRIDTRGKPGEDFADAPDTSWLDQDEGSVDDEEF